jgi:hypothetical protein
MMWSAPGKICKSIAVGVTEVANAFAPTQAELVALKPDVILATSGVSIMPLLEASRGPDRICADDRPGLQLDCKRSLLG